VGLAAEFPLYGLGDPNNKPKKKGTTMNPLTQFKKILTLPLLIALMAAFVRDASAT